MPTLTTTPVTLVTGFLGSGKTTLILSLVNTLQAEGHQVAYIKNEIGSENIDAQLVQGQHIQTKELLNGCICCTLVGPFIQAIDELVQNYQPERIIIEASGAADPAAIALMVSNHPKLVRDGVISVIDVVNFEGYKDLSETARRQAQFTDLIIFNKVELADDDRKLAVVGYVRELNQTAPIIEAPQGQLNPDVAFGHRSTDLNSLLAAAGDHSHHLGEDGLSSLTVTLQTPPTLPVVEASLNVLPKSVFRVKALLTMADGSVLLINKVGSRVDAQPITELSAPPVPQIVLIGFQLDDQAPIIKQQLIQAGLAIL